MWQSLSAAWRIRYLRVVLKALEKWRLVVGRINMLRDYDDKATYSKNCLISAVLRIIFYHDSKLLIMLFAINICCFIPEIFRFFVSAVNAA